MENHGGNNPEDPPTSSSYNLVKSIAVTLNDQELEKLKHVLKFDNDRRVRELAKQRDKEDNAFGFAAWREKRLGRYEKKFKERSKRYSCKRCGSAIETESDDPDEGYEYHVEETDSSDEHSYAVEDKKRMVRYHEEKLYKRYQHEKANLKIFAGFTREGEESDDDEELLEKETDEDEDSDESDSSDDDDVSPASSGSDYNEQYEEEDNWGYDGEDY